MKNKSVFIIIVIILGVILGVSLFSSVMVADFREIRWKRMAEDDTEYIVFSKDGSFVYYCSCGNPVDDSDLYEVYTYNYLDRVITLSSIYDDDLEKKIKVVFCDGDRLELDFGDGKIREFFKYESEF